MHVLVFLLLLLSSPVYAESSVNTTVETNSDQGSVTSIVNTTIESNGDSQSSVKVENKVESNGTVYKKTEVIINGEKKTIESTKPGTDQIQISFGTKKVESPPSATPKPSKQVIETSDVPTFIEKIRQSIEHFLQNFLK